MSERPKKSIQKKSYATQGFCINKDNKRSLVNNDDGLLTSSRGIKTRRITAQTNKQQSIRKDYKLERIFTKVKNSQGGIEVVRLSVPPKKIAKSSMFSCDLIQKHRNNDSLKNLIKSFKKDLEKEEIKINENMPFKKSTCLERCLTQQLKILKSEEEFEIGKGRVSLKENFKFLNNKNHEESSDIYANQSNINMIYTIEKSKDEINKNMNDFLLPNFKVDISEKISRNEKNSSQIDQRKIHKFNNIYDSQSEDDFFLQSFLQLLFVHMF